MKQLLHQASKIFLILILLISTGYTGMLGNNSLDIVEPASANSTKTYTLTSSMPSSYETTFPKSMTLTFNSSTGQVTMSHEYILGNQSGTSTLGWGYIASGTYNGSGGQMFKTGYVNSDGTNLINGLGVGSYMQFVMPPGGSNPMNWTHYGQVFNYVVASMASSGGGSCSGGDTIKKYTLSSSMPSSYETTFPKSITLSFNTSTNSVTMSHEYILGNQSGTSTLGWNYIASGTYNGSGGQMFKTGYVTSDGKNLINSLGVGSYWQFVMPPGGSNPMNWTHYGQVFNYAVTGMSSTTEGGNCAPATPAPAPAPAPMTCPSGTTKKGSGTSAYCEKTVINNVKQTEYTTPGFIKDINLGDLISNMGEFGSSGERGDGQFNLDSGNHNNGWHLNGNGDSYKSNHVQFTNIPDNGYVNALGDKWSPEYLITQGKNKIEVPLPSDSTTVEKQKRDTNLSNFKSTGSLSEVIAYKVTDLESLKTIQNTDKGLTDFFTKSGSNYKYADKIVSHKVDASGEGNYSNFKIIQSGYYILGSKYVDMVGAKKESASPSQAIIDKHTYYSFIPVSVNFMTDLGYLPIYNNLLTQINETMLTIGNTKSNHKLNNLAYGTYKSMKVPSAYNAVSGKTIIGSTSGGLQLIGKDLTSVSITDNTGQLASANVYDVVEHSNGFYIATDKGIHYLNCETNELSKTSVTEAVNDLELSYDTMYYLTDNKLTTVYLAEGELIQSNKSHDLTSMFKLPTSKAGRVEVVGNLITVSSKDDSTNSEIITLNK